jgi:hypothetical protein
MSEEKQPLDHRSPGYSPSPFCQTPANKGEVDAVWEAAQVQVVGNLHVAWIYKTIKWQLLLFLIVSKLILLRYKTASKPQHAHLNLNKTKAG